MHRDVNETTEGRESIFDPFQIERPDPALFRYYVLCSLTAGPLMPIALLPLWFRYMTLRYKFDESGVSMRWGILFRREVYLTYRRLQDIHLTRNIIQRWMGLAKISLQTASGSSQAEMTIEGILEAEPLRDFLYSMMRGAKDEKTASTITDTPNAPQGVAGQGNVESAQVTQVLTEIRDAMQTLAASSTAANTNDQSGGR